MLKAILIFVLLGSTAMAKLTGKTQGLSPSRLKKLKRALKLAGVDKNVQVLSGRRSMASVKRIYQNELNRKRGYYTNDGRKIIVEDKSLNDFIKDLNPEIKKKVQHILLRTEYDGPFKENFDVPPVKYSRRGGKAIAKRDLTKLFDKYKVDANTRKEINNRLFEKLRVDGKVIGSLRDGFGGVESAHVQGDKIDLVLSEIPKPTRNALESIGLKLLREGGKNVLDVNFKALDKLKDNFVYSPNVRENVLQSSMAKPKPSKPSMSFAQAFKEARSMGQKEFEFRGRRFTTKTKEEEESEKKPKFADDQKFDSVEEFERSKVDEKDKDITEAIMKVREDARKPEQEIEADDIELEQTIPMDQSVPFGIFARGTDEFRGAQEQAFAGAKGGEVNPRIPRKKGQPAKSKKHSDLYTDEDPRGTIQGLGFKDVPKAKSSVSKIRKSSRSHAHKVQAAVAMEQRAREMGKTSEAAVYRKFIDQMKERTKKMKKADGGEVESKRFISTLPFETRRKLADQELDEIGFKRIREAREKKGSKGFQAARVDPDEIEKIETKYGVFDEMSDEEKESEMRQNRMFQQGQFDFQNGGEVDEQMAAFRAADAQSMQQPTEEFQGDPITSRDPIEDVPEIQGFVPKRQPDVQPDIDPEVQDLETRPDPFPKRERSPDAQGVREFQLSQMSVDDLMNMTTPGVGRPADVNRELARRKKEFDGISLEKLAELDRDQEQREEDKKQKEEADRQKKERDKANKIVVEDKSQKELDEAELRKALDDSIVQAQKAAQAVDPKRFFKKMSTFDKIVGLIGLAAGAYESYKYGGPNFYEKEIEKEVEKDIKLQKLSLENEKRQLGVANFKVAQIARKLAMSTKNEEQRIRLLQTFQKFQQAGAKEVAAAQKQKGLMNVNFILNTRGITDAEMARFDSLYPGLKIRANSIKGRTGLNFFVRGGPSNLAKVKAYLADAQDSIDGLTDLYSYFDKISIIDQAVPIFSIDAAAAQSLRDRLVGKLRIEFFGPGVMTDSERAQAKRILGDPNALLTTDAREKPKILKLIMKLNYGVRDKLRRDGVAITKTPNDLRIEQMLSRRKLENNAKNRRFVIDALIQGEIDAQKAGKAPGSLWNMNEPLPV